MTKTALIELPNNKMSSDQDPNDKRAKSDGRVHKSSAQPQIGLFGDDPSTLKRPEQLPRVAEEAKELDALAHCLPKGLRYGTSSWSFPGWRGLVWRDEHAQGQLSREGLEAYSRHPLLTAAGVDRTYYGPMTSESFSDYAQQVDDDFRFVVKAWQNITSTSLRTSAGRWERNDDFLNAQIATDKVIVPALEGLEHRLGSIVFQFAPMPQRYTTRATGFAKRLGEFLSALPIGPTYAVEVRNPEFYTPELIDSIGNASARLCLSVHPKAIDLHAQADLARTLGAGPMVVRWMLKRDLEYASAKRKFAPFDIIQARDDKVRQAITDITQLELELGNEVTVIINNKAEGSAPASIEALSRLMAGFSVR